MDAVQAERQPLRNQQAGIVGGQQVAILVGLADQFHGGLDPQPVRVGHSEAQFSGIALRHQRQRQQQDSEIQQDAHSLGRGSLIISARERKL